MPSDRGAQRAAEPLTDSDYVLNDGLMMLTPMGFASPGSPAALRGVEPNTSQSINDVREAPEVTGITGLDIDNVPDAPDASGITEFPNFEAPGEQV